MMRTGQNRSLYTGLLLLAAVLSFASCGKKDAAGADSNELAKTGDPLWDTDGADHPEGEAVDGTVLFFKSADSGTKQVQEAYYDKEAGQLTYGGVVYSVDEKKKKAVVYTYEDLQSDRLTIPKTVRYGKLSFKVTGIGESAFYGSELKKIVLPESIVEIGEGAFYGCESLQQMQIPAGVQVIREGTFYGCAALKSITLSEGVHTIEAEAFYGCGSLTSITLPETVKEIGAYAFGDCILLQEITLPSLVTRLPDYLFSYCASLKTVRLPEGLLSIGVGVFEENAALKELALPKGLLEIDFDAFYHCSFTKMRLPASLATEDDFIFSGCDDLKTVEVPKKKLAYYQELFQNETFRVAGY